MIPNIVIVAATWARSRTVTEGEKIEKRARRQADLAARDDGGLCRRHGLFPVGEGGLGGGPARGDGAVEGGGAPVVAADVETAAAPDGAFGRGEKRRGLLRQRVRNAVGAQVLPPAGLHPEPVDELL